MDNKKRSGVRSIFNIFDIVVIIIALVLAAVLLISKGSSDESAGDTPVGSSLTYTIELNNMKNGAGELISEGDTLIDVVKKYNIGVVSSVEIRPSTVLVEDIENGRVIESEVSNQQNATVVVTASCNETSSLITIDGGFAVRVGEPVSVRGPGYWGSGYIVAIERSGDK